jgi:hypothetical protein
VGSVTTAAPHLATEHLPSASSTIAVSSELGGAAFASASTVSSSTVA